MVHLREEGEGLCLEHVKALSFADHRTCDFASADQQWIYDPTLMVLKLASAMDQCLDFFPEHQDFGVWSCHDSANNEFVYDRVGKLCQRKAKNSCVQNATAEDFYLQLRLPGEASCFHFGGQFDGKTHLIIHRTCEERTEQWWQFERETLSFKHSTDSSICLNWNTDKQGFDIWKCYNTPKQQFQFSKFRLTYCLRHDLRQCLQAVENLASSGLQLRLPGETSCLQYGSDRPLSHEPCRVTYTQQRWLFESSTMRFRHSELNQNCLQFEEEGFTALECSTEPKQKFHASFGTDGRKYCIGKDERKCVQEATLGAHPPSIGRSGWRLPSTSHPDLSNLRPLPARSRDPADTARARIRQAPSCNCTCPWPLSACSSTAGCRCCSRPSATRPSASRSGSLTRRQACSTTLPTSLSASTTWKMKRRSAPSPATTTPPGNGLSKRPWAGTV